MSKAQKLISGIFALVFALSAYCVIRRHQLWPIR